MLIGLLFLPAVPCAATQVDGKAASLDHVSLYMACFCSPGAALLNQNELNVDRNDLISVQWFDVRHLWRRAIKGCSADWWPAIHGTEEIAVLRETFKCREHTGLDHTACYLVVTSEGNGSNSGLSLTPSRNPGQHVDAVRCFVFLPILVSATIAAPEADNKSHVQTAGPNPG